MKDRCEQLGPNRNLCAILCAQELLGGIELAKCPYPRNQNRAVGPCDSGYGRVLTKANQYSVWEWENNDDWNHDYSYHEPSSIEQISTSFKHPDPITLWLVGLLAGSVSLRYQTFEGAIQPLHDGESKDVDEHVAHSDAGDQWWIVDVTHWVCVYQLNQLLEDHTYYRANS